TTTAPIRRPARGPWNAAAAASARESAPPEQATSTVRPAGRSASAVRTTRRQAATAGCGPGTDTCSGVDALDPGVRPLDLGGGGQGLGAGPHLVEPVDPHDVHDRPAEGGPV